MLFLKSVDDASLAGFKGGRVFGYGSIGVEFDAFE